MLTLNDGRNELWQWDTGRTLTVDADCSQVHFSNKVFGRSIDVDVVDGVATIPDILLQTDKELTAWAFVGTPENGYTKISKIFKVNKRNKPADYVFTPSEQTTLGEILERLEDVASAQDPDAIKNAVDDYLANNPIGDGFSPIANVEQTANGAVITITDKDGTTTATITNGKDGKDGVDGQPGKDGADGAPGEKGDKGDKGEKGDTGEQGKDNLPNIAAVSGAAVTLTMDNNVEYHCTDAVTALTIEGFTPAADGKSSLWAIQFTAGESITVSLPDTVVWNYGATPVFTPGSEYCLMFSPLLSGKVLGVWNEVEA